LADGKMLKTVGFVETIIIIIIIIIMCPYALDTPKPNGRLNPIHTYQGALNDEPPKGNNPCMHPKVPPPRK
jgi:hypothetical protein